MAYYDSEDDIDYSYLIDEIVKGNLMAERVTVFVPGTIYWAKIIGAPRPNYDGDAREWSYDLVPDDTTFLKEQRLLDRLKEGKEPMKGDFIRLKKPEFTKDGDKNEPIRIYNSNNEAWDDKLLGNGTRVVAKLQIVDWGKGKKKSIYTQALRVEELVPYESNAFGAFDGGSKGTAKPKASAKKGVGGKTILEELDELDDEVPAFD